MLKEKYEISLWENVWVSTYGGHYEERKIGIIGSDTITATCRAFEPQLVENVDGTCRFTFKMLIQCRDDTYEELLRQFVVRPSSSGSTHLEDFYVPQNGSSIPFLIRSTVFLNNQYKNPFLSLLTNERKVKVFWKDKWYDLIIKNCQEDSEHKTITYTCTDVFINELSKSGLDLVFDNELENNTGNVSQLAAVVLNGTDWQVDSENSDLIRQTKEEAVFELQLEQNLPDVVKEIDNTTLTISSGETILVFYDQIIQAIDACKDQLDISSATTYVPSLFQFGYASSYEGLNNGAVISDVDCCDRQVKFSITGSVNNNGVVNWAKVRIFYLTTLSERTIGYVTVGEYSGNDANPVSNYRALRLVRKQKSVYDPLTKHYCDIYEAISSDQHYYSTSATYDSNITYYVQENDQFVMATSSTPSSAELYVAGPSYEVGDIIYKYTETEYHDPLSVNNLIVNGEGFTSVEGWSGPNLRFQLYPSYTTGASDYNPKSYLKLEKYTFYNAGMRYNSNYLPDGFSEGERYIVRYKGMSDTNGSPSGTYIHDVNEMNPIVSEYIINESNQIEIKTPVEPYATLIETSYNGDWNEYEIQFIRSATRSEIYEKKIGLFIRRNYALTSDVIWLENLQFFPLVYGLNENNEEVRVNPGELNTTAVLTTTYYYYNHTKCAGLIYAEDIPYIWRSDTDLSNELGNIIKPVYNENFEKILTISAKQSNRYNLLRTLAEKFECYVRFEIQHDQLTGKVIYNNGVPQKKVYFKSDQGQQTGIGFIYGIDLKAVQRTIQSDQIVTKMVVAQNNNQFAKNGFCTIARSFENYPMVNFILNFDYYISQNLVDSLILRRVWVYYWYLHWLNSIYTTNSDALIKLNNIYLKQNSYLTLYESAISNTSIQIDNVKNTLAQLMLVNVTDVTDEFCNNYINAHVNAEDVRSNYYSWKMLEQTLEDYEKSYSELLQSTDDLKARITNIQSDMDSNLSDLAQLHQDFYRKHSQFIQEGSWKDDNYTDDNLYYLDALKATREASRPKVSYNISVIRVSCLDEYKSKVFHLGDITYIQDTEFFGYTYIDGIKTPYREKVLISEITSYFDEPDKDTFKVQNYKTDFEDLFQRLNYTSQEYIYSSDGYDKINYISTSNGLIDPDVLQDSIDGASMPINLNGNKITQDGNGIIVSDLTQANKQTRITSGGIFTSVDGGETWKNAVNAEGVPIESLSSGVLDITKVNIVDKENNMSWTKGGISVYDSGASNAIIQLSSEGMKMDGAYGDAGVTYDSQNRVKGTFDTLCIMQDDNKSIVIDDDEIQFSNESGMRGTIVFHSDNIKIYPTRNNPFHLTVATDKVIVEGTYESELASLDFDIGKARMAFNWYDATLSSNMTTAIDLKTFRVIT